MKQIVIQVIGGTGVGKTTVCEMIKELFDLYGIESDFVDPDLPHKANLIVPRLDDGVYSIDEEETKRREKERKTKRVISVINSLDKILIEEKQAHKRGVDSYYNRFIINSDFDDR